MTTLDDYTCSGCGNNRAYCVCDVISAAGNGDTPLTPPDASPFDEPGYLEVLEADLSNGDIAAEPPGDELAGVDAPSSSGEEPPDDGKRKRPTRDDLIDLAEASYTIARSEDERVFLIPDDGPNVALFSGAAKADLARRYRDTTGNSVGRTPLDEAWVTIEGLALDVPKQPLPLRVASHDGHLVVDLGDTTGHAVVIDVDGWQIVDRSPVTFRRSKAILPLPKPTAGGNVDELFALLRIAERSRDLFTGWLTSTLFADMPHPAPVFRGEQGAAKSSTVRATSRLLDPCMADTQKPPKDADEWSQSCASRWVLGVDNVSTIPEWWSDALCRTITGDGWLRRQLYTDDEVVVTKWRRCVILNGISLGASLRPDLAERLLFFDLERPDEFLTEAEVDDRLDAMAPRVFGALLDRAAATLKALADTEPVRDLRMADFAHLLAAYDAACGTDALDGYRRQLDEAFDEALAGDPVATAVIEFMNGRDEWTGTATELYKALVRPLGDDYWPRSAHALAQVMTRSAAALRRVGIVWMRPRHDGVRRVASLRRIDPTRPNAPNADNGDSLLVVSGGEEEKSSGGDPHTQQGGNLRYLHDSPLGGDCCPVCGEAGYDRATAMCRADGCPGL